MDDETEEGWGGVGFIALQRPEWTGRSSKNMWGEAANMCFSCCTGSRASSPTGVPTPSTIAPRRVPSAGTTHIAHPGERFDGVRWQASPKAKMQQKWSDQDRKRTQSSLEGNVHSRACKWAVDGKTLADAGRRSPRTVLSLTSLAPAAL